MVTIKTNHMKAVHVTPQKQPPEVFYKKSGLKNFAILTGKHLFWNFFITKLQASSLATLVFSYEYCEIFKSNYFKEPLPTADSDPSIRKLLHDFKADYMRELG